MSAPLRVATYNGVAAGDVTADSVALWTRSLAPGDVTFAVSDASGVVTTVAATVTDLAAPVKVVVESLTAGTAYT